MKRYGLILSGALALTGYAQAMHLGAGPGTDAKGRGVDVPLGAFAIAQMANNTPVPMGGASCSDHENGTTGDNSWWRRFYLAEHGAPSSLTIESVTVGAETGSAPVVVRLYTIPHGVAPGTLPLDQLHLIGQSASTVVTGNLDTTTIPVSGLVADAIGHDLVVEYHTDGSATSAFYAGGNATTQTHEAFLSSNQCGVEQPTPMSEVGFPDAHMIVVANAAAPAIGLAKAFAPDVVRASNPSTLTITLANPLATAAALTADLVDTFPAGMVVADTPNATTTCGGGLSASAGATSVTLSTAGATIPPLGHCTVTVDVTASQGVHDNALTAGALQTDQGSNAIPARAALTVIPPGGNGIHRSGPINRPLPATSLGASFNLVSAALNDAGSRNAAWDVNFSFGLNEEAAELAVFTFNAIAPNQTGYLVDSDGRARLLQDGDVVGPASTFSSDEAVIADPAWLAGAEGAVGVRFRCNGRLAYPVVGGQCYGMIRLVTTNTIGYPARLVESAFDGDGEPFTVTLPPATQPPAATLTPSSLSIRVAANETRTQTLRISNAAGSHPLNYAIAAQGEAAALVPREEDLVPFGSGPRLQHSSLLKNPSGPMLRSVGTSDLRGVAQAPWTPAAGFPYLVDDGSYENAIGLGQMPAVWLNRFSVLDAQTINSVSILWPRQPEGGSLLGLQANIVAYYDASGSGNPTNAVRLGGDHLVSIDRLDTFESYPTQFEVPAAGDVYIGFVEHWAMQGYPLALFAAAIDSNSLQGHSYISVSLSDELPPALDITDLSNNDFTGSLVTMTGGYLGGNWLVRATGTSGACSGPALPWLSATSTGSQVVVGGASAEVAVKADPSAAMLAPGNYSAELCIASNDPSRRVMAVPITLEVTPATAAHACSHRGDSLFCAGFDPESANDIVSSGVINLDLPRSGVSLDFALAEWSQGTFFGDDFMPYWNDMMPFMMFYWHGDVMPGANGGVAETALGPYRVLRSGDTIGPSSTFSAVANGDYGETTNFLAGVDGYLGFKFFNEQTGQTNYGYMRLITTWPSGYPATLVDYAYNKSGGPITIP